MRFLHTFTSALALATSGARAASSWSFSEGAVSLVGQSDSQQTLAANAPLDASITLGPQDTIKVSLTTQEGGKAKRAHQAFLVLRDNNSGLEAPFPLDVKDNGKGTVEIPQKDLPVQLAIAPAPLTAHVLIGSFGNAQPLDATLFGVEVVRASDDTSALTYEAPLRYGKRDNIFHQYNEPAKYPPVVISIAFAAVIVAALPALLGGWLFLGGNLDHACKALGAAPVSHGVFFGSLIALEGALFAYHTVWNLFQLLPVVAVIGVVAFFSGSKALGEVQGRRLAGER